MFVILEYMLVHTQKHRGTKNELEAGLLLRARKGEV